MAPTSFHGPLTSSQRLRPGKGPVTLSYGSPNDKNKFYELEYFVITAGGRQLRGGIL